MAHSSQLRAYDLATHELQVTNNVYLTLNNDVFHAHAQNTYLTFLKAENNLNLVNKRLCIFVECRYSKSLSKCPNRTLVITRRQNLSSLRYDLMLKFVFPSFGYRLNQQRVP